jgi:L-threonylcarbamoyladenylate synthase
MTSSVTLQQAAERLDKGQIGVLPTDTLLGIVCKAHDRHAVQRLYAVKQRENKPGTLIGNSVEQLSGLGIKKRYLTAVQHYWPNPISIVVPCADIELAYLHLGKQSLAVRIPDNRKLQTLLEKTGPLLTSSANMPGEPPARTISEAEGYFGNDVDFYTAPLPDSTNKPSTVIRVVDDAVLVLRQGLIKIHPETGAILTQTQDD